jgi:hypothetical protein
MQLAEAYYGEEKPRTEAGLVIAIACPTASGAVAPDVPTLRLSGAKKSPAEAGLSQSLSERAPRYLAPGAR